MLKQIERQGNSLSPVVRDAFDSRQLRTLTRNSPLKATGAHVSIVGHITADELTRRLSETESANGFANRFLFCWADRSKLLPLGGSPDYEPILRIVRRVRGNIEGIPNHTRIVFSPEARAMWCDYLYAELSGDIPDLVGSLCARQEAHALRLAMLYAAIEGVTEIQPEHLCAAAAVVRYSVETVRHIFGDHAGDPVADRILEAVRGSDAGLTRTQISCGVFNRNTAAGEIERAIAALLAAGKVTIERLPGEGRPSKS